MQKNDFKLQNLRGVIMAPEGLILPRRGWTLNCHQKTGINSLLRV